MEVGGASNPKKRDPSTTSTGYYYYPQRIFARHDYALVLLNREIQLNPHFFLSIWNNATLRHVIDGGANHFFHLMDSSPEMKELKLPELATGAFDSITPDSMRRLKDCSTTCQVIRTEDQNETDLSKGLRVLRDKLSSNEVASKVSRVIVISEFTGRLDQIMANVNTLLHTNPFQEEQGSSSLSTLKGTISLYLLSATTLTWLLPGDNDSNNTKSVIINFEADEPNFVCGLLPFLGPTSFESSGLQWNLNPDMTCRFGGLLSTSNKVKEKRVQIKGEHPSIFTVELKFLDYIWP